MGNFIKKIRNISVFKTLWFGKKYAGGIKNAMVYRYTKLNLHRDCKVQIDGKLSLGYSGGKLYPWNQTTLQTGKNSKFTIYGKHTVYHNVYICLKDNGRLSVGKDGYFNHGVAIQCASEITIGDHVYIAPNVAIQDHDEHVIIKEGYEETKPIHIKDYVWIGKNATILKGVTIGEHSVVAAGAIVTKDVPSHCLVGGVPARILAEGIDWK